MDANSVDKRAVLSPVTDFDSTSLSFVVECIAEAAAVAAAMSLA